MNTALVDQIAKAVLYEGYMLYPYRPSAVKNQQRFNFGVVYPLAFSQAQKGLDRWSIQSECLVQGSALSRLAVRVRCLQLVERFIEEVSRDTASDSQVMEFSPVQALTVGGRTFHSWQEAVEREFHVPPVDLDLLSRYPALLPIQLSASKNEEPLHDDRMHLAGRVLRIQHAIEGSIHVSAQQVAENFFKVTVRVKNETVIDSAHLKRELALLRSLVAAHIVLGVEDGDFASMLEPPDALRGQIEDCSNEGVFPVLVGEAGRHDTVLASPIILYDYPQIAPESAGDLFDGTEIDEILSLRIMTMTDDEKREMRESDERARQMLDRTENMPAEQFMKLHGALRGLRPLGEGKP
jgi:hypothetical protein